MPQGSNYWGRNTKTETLINWQVQSNHSFFPVFPTEFTSQESSGIFCPFPYLTPSTKAWRPHAPNSSQPLSFPVIPLSPRAATGALPTLLLRGAPCRPPAAGVAPSSLCPAGQHREPEVRPPAPAPSGLTPGLGGALSPALRPSQARAL